MVVGIFVNNSKNILETKCVYAQASEYDAEPYVEGEITSIEVNVDYSKTNEYGVAGIFTSMDEQDLIDGEYLSLTVNYFSGESEAITSGYTLSMNSETFFEGNVNEVTLTYNDFSTVFMINATAVYLQRLEVDTTSLDEVDIFESYLVNDLNQYIEVTGVNNDGSPFNNSAPISFDATGENGYTLQGPSSGELSVGNNNITVSYQNATGNFVVNAIERELVRITAKFEQPSEAIYSTTYLSDLTEYLTVYAYYNDNGEPEELDPRYYSITGDLFTDSVALETETVVRTCTVEVQGNEEITADFDVIVTPDIPVSVSVMRGSYNRYYFAQDTFNTTGLTIMVQFKHAGLITVDDHFYVIYQGDDNRLHVGDEYVQIGYSENGVTATASSNIPVEVEQMEITRVSLPAHDFTYIEDEDPEEQTHSLTINYYNSQRMTIEIAPESAQGMTIDEDTGELSAINAGIYIVNVILTDDYIWTGGFSDPITLQWEIKPASYSSTVSISSWYYGDTASTPHVTNNPGNVSSSSIIYYYYGQSADGTFSFSRDDLNRKVPTSVGEYRVYAYIPAGGNYSDTTTTDTLFYIRISDNTLNAEDYTWQYDEENINKTNPSFTTKFDLQTNYSVAYYQGENLIGSNDYSYDGTFLGEEEYFPINVGLYTVRIVVEGTENYNDGTIDINLTITRKPIDISPNLDETALTYQGSGQESVVREKVLSSFDASRMSFVFSSTDDVVYSTEEKNGAYYEIDENSISFFVTNVIENGGYVVTLSIGDNYAWADSTTEDLVFKWIIKQAENEVTITNLEEFEAGWEYVESGLTFSPTYSAQFYQVDEPTITYYKADGNELGENLGDENPTDAGEYFVVVSVEETVNYSSAGASCKFEIRQKIVGIPTLNHNSDIYNEEEKTNYITGYDAVSMTIDAENTTVQYEISSTNINLTELYAGTYNLTLKLVSANYIWSDDTVSDKTYTWIIEKASLTKPTLSASTEYTSYEQQLDLSLLGVTADMDVQVGLDMQEIGLSLESLALSATDARSYNVSISILDADNYKWSGTADTDEAEILTLVWTINKAILNVDWGETTFVYSGREIIPTASITGWLGSDSNATSGNYTTSVSGGEVNVGTDYTATLSITRKDGGNVNYSLSSTQINFNITKAPLYVTWLDTSLEYNGQNQTPTYEVTDFLIANEMNIYSYSFTLTGKNVGQYSTELVLQSNNETMNYELYNTNADVVGATTEFTISEATLVVDWGDLEFEYDGTAKQPTPTVEGWFGEDEELYSITVSIDEEHINAGNYTAKLTLSLVDGTDEDAINYVLNDSEEAFEILKAKIDVSLIVSEPEIEGNEIINDRRMPHTGSPIELIIKNSEDGLYDFAENKYLNSSFEPVDLESIVSANQVFYMVLELSDADNYEWYNYNSNDVIVDNGKTIRLWYEITQTQFNMLLEIPELDELNQIVYGNSYSYQIGYNPNNASFSVSYYKVDGASETLLDAQPVDAGDYKISVTIEASGNYDRMTAEIYYSILKRTVSVNITVSDSVYGGFVDAFIADSDISNLAGDGYNTLTGSDFTFNYTSRDEGGHDDTESPVNVGLYSVEAILEHENYEINETTVDFEITRAPLSITINSDELEYGDADPTILYSGTSYITYEEGQLKNGDAIDDLGIIFIYATNYVQGYDALGDYYIYLSSYGDEQTEQVLLDNYNLTINRGDLVVNKKQISATIDIAGQTFVYDNDNIYRGSVAGATATPSWTYLSDIIEFTYSYVGISGTEYSQSEVAPINAGTYQVEAKIKEDADAFKNYLLPVTTASFTISRASLSITIKNAEIVYGDADPTASYNDASFLTYNQEELKGGDTIENIGLTFVYSSNYVQGDNAFDDYYIYLSTYGEESVVSASIQNYTLSINAGVLTVVQKEITASIDIDGQSFEYDGNNLYLGDVVGAVAEPDWSYNDEQIAFTYIYEGIDKTEYTQSEVAPIDVGNYKVTAMLTAGSESAINYSFAEVSATFEIYKKQVEVVWTTNKDTFIYNSENQAINNGIVAKYVPADDDADNDGILNIAIIEGESEFVNVGLYTFEASLILNIEKRNYELIGNVTKSFEIVKATITEISWNYTDENYFIYNGQVQSNSLVFATYVGEDALTHNLSIDRITQNGIDEIFRNAGTYEISVKLSEIDDKNYQFASELVLSKNYTIENADITLQGEVEGYSGIYDATQHSVVSSLPDLVYVEEAGSPTWSYRIKTDDNSNDYISTLTLQHVGEYDIEFMISIDNHNPEYGEFHVSITKKSLVLTASTEIEYGNNITQDLSDYIIIPAGGSEFAGSENSSVLNGTPVFSTNDYLAGESGVGEYTLTFSGFTSNDYDISYEEGIINVVPRQIEITITPISRTYGEGLTNLPANTYSAITSGGLLDVLPEDIYSLGVYSDESLISLTTDLDVGTYDVKPIDINENYNIIEVINGEGAYSITRRPIYIRITGNSYEYDGQRHGVIASISTEGVDLEITTLYSSETYGGENGTTVEPWEVGVYDVVAQIVDEDEAGNYQINYEAGAELTIYARSISIVIEDQSADYSGKLPTVNNVMGDSSNPQNWYINSTNGLCENVNGEMDDLNVVLSIPENSINAGTYEITGTYDNKNYNVIAWTKGEFTINEIPLSISIRNQTINYGYEHEEFEIVYDGFIEGENENTPNIFNNGIPTAVTEYEIGDGIGEYDMTYESENITSRNYDITFTTGTLNVIEREITLAIKKQSAYYSGAKPTVSSLLNIGFEVVSEVGIYETDNLNVVLTIENASVYNAGSYDINYTYDNPNYFVTWQTGSNIDAFTINKVELIVKANDITIQYGNEPSNSYVISGFVNNENEEVIEGLEQISFNNVGYSVGLGVDTPAGSITLNGVDTLTATNYTFVSSSGQWTIIKRNIDIEIDTSKFYQGQTNVYGEYDTDTPFASAKVNVVSGGLVGEDIAGDSGDVDILFNYKYYGISNDGSWNYSENGSSSMPDKAGSYTVEVTITSDNYRLNSDAETFTLTYIILKHRVATPSWETASFDATGEERQNRLVYEPLYSRVLTSSHPITSDESGVITMIGTEGGEYSVTLTLEDADNYVWSSATGSITGDNPSVVIRWTISRNNDNEFTSDITIEVDGDIVGIIDIEGKSWFNHTWIYEDAFEEPIATAKYGEVEFNYYYSESGELVGGIPKNAGNYYVIASVTGTADWNGITSDPIYFTIERKALETPNIENVQYQHGAIIKQIVNNFNLNYMTALGSNVELVYENEKLYLQATNVYSGGYFVNIALKDTANYEWNNGSNSTIRLAWNILPQLVEKPNLTEQTFVYDGSVKNFIVEDSEDSDYYRIVSGDSAIDAGTYQIVISLINNINYAWMDNSITNLTQTWSITPKEVAIPVIENKIYNHGEIVQAKISNYDNNILSIANSGEVYITTSVVRDVQYFANVRDAGTYQIEFSLRDTQNYDFVAPNTLSDSVIVTWTVSPYPVLVPNLSAGQSYTYTGEEILYDFEDTSDSDYYIVSGNVGISADEYRVEVSLIDAENYVWDGGGTITLSQEWNIIPAEDNKVTVSNQALFEDGWVYGDEAVELLATSTYGGAITVEYFTDNSQALEKIPSDAGKYYAVVLSHSEEGNFNDASITINFEIHKAKLVISPYNYSITYGENLPEIYVVASGLVNEDSIEDLGVLLIETNYDLSSIQARKVGDYEISLSGLDETNYEITYNKATLTVVPMAITVTLQNQSSIYSGDEPNIDQMAYDIIQDLPFEDELGLNIIKQPGVNAGSYVLSASANNDNYDVTIVSAEFTIEKQIIQAGSLTLNDATFVADGDVYSLTLSGNLPAGVIVEYTNNVASLPGIYHVEATLVYDAQNVTYVGENAFTAVMTINFAELSVQDDYRKDRIVVSTENGFNPNYQLKIDEITDLSGYDFSEYENTVFVSGYNLKIVEQDNVVDTNYPLEINMLLPASDGNYILLINKNSVLTEIEYEKQGEYAVFDCDSLGEFIFLEVSKENDMLWLIIVLAVMLILLLIWFISAIVRAKKLSKASKSNLTNVKINSFLPFSLLLTLTLPTSQFVSIIVLAGICLLLLIVSIIITVKNRKKIKDNKQQVEQVVISEPIKSPENRATVASEISNKADTSMIFSNLRVRSFFTKLRKADQETKDKYREIKKFLKTLEGVNLSTSKRQVRVYKGRKTLANIFFKGKTLCIAFALNPQTYERTRYQGTDVSEIKRFKNTPMLLKLTSNRRVESAKHLFKQCLL